jgi:hypothetical protein
MWRSTMSNAAIVLGVWLGLFIFLFLEEYDV